jgi:hypothetical protein
MQAIRPRRHIDATDLQPPPLGTKQRSRPAGSGGRGTDSAEPLGQVLHDYFSQAAKTTMSRYHESADDVPEGLSIPR